MSNDIDLSVLPERFRTMREPFNIRESRLIRRALAVALGAGRALRVEAETKKEFQGSYGHFADAVTAWDEAIREIKEMGDGQG